MKTLSKIDKLSKVLNTRHKKIENYDFNSFIDKHIIVIIYLFFIALFLMFCDMHFFRVILGFKLFSVNTAVYVDRVYHALLGYGLVKFIFSKIIGSPNDLGETVESMDK